jgi:hypothetical protein
MTYIWFVKTVVGGSFFGSLFLAMAKKFQPERIGFINRWNYFFWFVCLPRLLFPATVILFLIQWGYLKL